MSCQKPTCGQGAIRAKKTVQQIAEERVRRLRWVADSSELLLRAGHALFFERIQADAAARLRGHGRGSGQSLKRLVTLCCPSNSGPVALVLATKENGCSCSLCFPTPMASQEHKRIRPFTPAETARRFGRQLIGIVGQHHPQYRGQYLHPSFVELLMGFPLGWTDLDASETP